MPSYSFRSDDPSLHALDVDHGPEGLAVERIMFHESYTNPNHPLHARAVSDVGAWMSTVTEKPANGGQPFKVQSINSATGEVINRE